MNPFIYMEPVRGDDFINREKIVTQLLNLTIWGRTHGHVWLTGERQVGKTSTLRYIQSTYENSKKTVTIYGDTQIFRPVIIYTNVQDCATRDKFYQNLWQGLKNYFDFKIKKKKDSLVAFLDALKYTYTKNYYVLFLIDEFDALVQNLNNRNPVQAIEFLGELNKISAGLDIQKKSPRVFSCIFTANTDYAGLIKTIDLGSDSGSGLITIGKDLSWFTKIQIKQLAQHYLKNTPVEFSDKDIDFCYRLTKGYPYFTQMLFSMLYKKKEQKLKENEYKKQIKVEYADNIKTTLVTWGGKKMPERTKNKLLELGEYIGDKIITTAMAIIVHKVTGN